MIVEKKCHYPHKYTVKKHMQLMAYQKSFSVSSRSHVILKTSIFIISNRGEAPY